MVAMRAGRYDIFPTCFPTQPARDNMIDGQVLCVASTVLAGVIVSAKDLFPGEFDDGTRALNHPVKADHGGEGKCLGNGMNHTSSV